MWQQSVSVSQLTDEAQLKIDCTAWKPNLDTRLLNQAHYYLCQSISLPYSWIIVHIFITHADLSRWTVWVLVIYNSRGDNIGMLHEMIVIINISCHVTSQPSNLLAFSATTNWLWPALNTYKYTPMECEIFTVNK